MGISYKPLFRLLLDRNMKKTDLSGKLGFSSATLAKLGKGKPLSGENIEKLCIYFKCQPNDLVEITWNDSPEPAVPEPAAPAPAALHSAKKPAKQSALPATPLEKTTRPAQAPIKKEQRGRNHQAKKAESAEKPHRSRRGSR